MDDQTYTSLADEVSRYQRAVDEVRADKHLSDEGKAVKLEELYTKVKAKTDAAHASSMTSEAGERQRLHQRLLGIPYGVAAPDFRDAQDRAAKIRRPEEAAQALEEASKVGDRVLERAVLGVVWQKTGEITAATGWGPVLQSYLDQNQDLLPAFDRYAELSSQQSQGEKLLTKLATSPMKPSELRNRRLMDAQRSA